MTLVCRARPRNARTIFARSKVHFRQLFVDAHIQLTEVHLGTCEYRELFVDAHIRVLVQAAC